MFDRYDHTMLCLANRRFFRFEIWRQALVKNVKLHQPGNLNDTIGNYP
jgi:hypothetical protein